MTDREQTLLLAHELGDTVRAAYSDAIEAAARRGDRKGLTVLHEDMRRVMRETVAGLARFMATIQTAPIGIPKDGL